MQIKCQYCGVEIDPVQRKDHVMNHKREYELLKTPEEKNNYLQELRKFVTLLTLKK